MGLRVATLVNLSFVGGDVADEKAARFLGKAQTSRAIPEGIRRFGTWAPLLLPFYIPRGAEWDKAWSAAERMAQTAAAVLRLSGRRLFDLRRRCCLRAGDFPSRRLARARQIDVDRRHRRRRRSGLDGR